MIPDVDLGPTEDFISTDADLGVMHHPKLSPVLTGEMSRLYSAGFWLVPLGLDRKPLAFLKKKDGSPAKRLPLSVVISKMAGAGSSNYGVRLPGLIVIDIDTDTPEAHEYVARRFGVSTVQIKSPKGVHHYFRLGDARPKNVKLPGIAIDFKSGCQEHVSGPFAERVDGGHYLPLAGHLKHVEALPMFADHEPDRRFEDWSDGSASSRVAVGTRNKHLCSIAVSYVSCSDTKPDLLADLIAYRNIHFDDPGSFSDSEIEGIVDWAFKKKLEGKIFHGRRSGVFIQRETIDRLAALGDGTALLLYSVLQADHGHRPDFDFSIVPDALRQAGKLKVGRRQIYEAIQTLVDEGLIEITFQSTKPKIPHRYKLKERERFITYIDTPNGHKGFTVYEGGKSGSV